MGNSKSNSRNDQVSPGDDGYNESFKAYSEAKKKMLECMKAHSDHYHPFLAAMKFAKEQYSSFEPPTAHGKAVKGKEKQVHLFSSMKEDEGPCREAWKAKYSCKNSEDNNIALRKCLGAHYDYYRAVITALDAVKERAKKEFEPILFGSVKESFYSTWYLFLTNSPEGWFKSFMTRGGCKESYMAFQNCFEELRRKEAQV